MPYMDIDSSFMLDAFQYMKENADYQDDPELGPFWYDPVKKNAMEFVVLLQQIVLGMIVNNSINE